MTTQHYAGAGKFDQYTDGSPVHEHWVTAVTNVIEIMRDRLDEPHPLIDISRSAFLSPFYFHRIFCRVTSSTPARFLMALRIAEAKRLLVETSASCTEISIAVGYSSFGTFTSQFTRLVGVPPGRFRRYAAMIGDLPIGTLLDRLSALLGYPARGHAVEIGARPDGLAARVVIGAFRADGPQERPVGCALADTPGTAHLATQAQSAQILAVSPHPDATAGDLLAERPAARLCVGTAVHAARRDHGPRFSLELRPQRITDPPVVFAFPLAVVDGTKP